MVDVDPLASAAKIMDKKDYAILTAEISRATFGMTPSEYRKFKSIPDRSKANLRDNMTDLELIFTMLGEKVTTEISKKEKPAICIAAGKGKIRTGSFFFLVRSLFKMHKKRRKTL